MPMPLEIVGLGQATVTVVWDDDRQDVWPARTLRQKCTCAYCVSEMTGERLLDPESVPTDITVKNMHLVGNYGLGIEFSDGHSTGIYRFRELHDKAPR